MAVTPRIDAPSSETIDGLARARMAYRYRGRAENQLSPIATALKWPWLKEQYGPAWAIPFVPFYLGAYANFWFKTILFTLHRLTFRLQKLAAYDRLWRRGEKPAWTAEEVGFSDAAFAFMRIAGSNSVVIEREPELLALEKRIPLDVARIENWLAGRGRSVSLAEEARAGRLFSADFRIPGRAYSPRRDARRQKRRYRRWRKGCLNSLFPIGSLGKFRWADIVEAEPDIAVDAAGSQGLGWEGPGFEQAELERTKKWLITRADSIWGGTNEIQRNVIAKRVLGIPE